VTSDTTATRTVKVGQIPVGGAASLVLIAGPCVIENEDLTLSIAEKIQNICHKLSVGFIFKASFDKGNRTSMGSYRGPGLDDGLRILAGVREKLGVPVTTDIHDISQIDPIKDVVDLIQIPAFLCRQTGLLAAVAQTDLPVNVKKGQFLSPWDTEGIVGKVRNGEDLLITERGTTFGYNNLVVDFRSFPVIRSLGIPVVYDATHSLQLPGGLGSSSGGQREYIPHLLRAAVACGIDAIFMEVHPDPDNAPCDGPNMWPLGELENLLRTLLAIYSASFKEGEL